MAPDTSTENLIKLKSGFPFHLSYACSAPVLIGKAPMKTKSGEFSLTRYSVDPRTISDKGRGTASEITLDVTDDFRKYIKYSDGHKDKTSW